MSRTQKPTGQGQMARIIHKTLFGDIVSVKTHKRVCSHDASRKAIFRKFDDNEACSLVRDVNDVKDDMIWLIKGMDVPELKVMMTVLNEYENELTSQHLKQFYFDVQTISPSESRHGDQYQIYNKLIAEYLESNEIYKQKDVFSLLKNPPDSSPSRAMKRLINENKMFCVTFKSQGANVGYPAFQFDTKKGQVKPLIKRILDTLGGKFKDWDLLAWFNSYDDDLECKPLEAIDNPSLQDLLIEIADNENQGIA